MAAIVEPLLHQESSPLPGPHRHPPRPPRLLHPLRRRLRLRRLDPPPRRIQLPRRPPLPRPLPPRRRIPENLPPHQRHQQPGGGRPRRPPPGPAVPRPRQQVLPRRLGRGPPPRRPSLQRPGHRHRRAALQWAVGPRSDEWLEEHGDRDRVFLAGDSAGASLAHYAACVAASSDSVRVAGIVLVHPYFGLPNSSDEFRSAWKVMSDVDLDDPRLNPMANRGKGMGGASSTRVMVAVAAEDSLKVNGTEYLESLEKSSGWGGEAVMVETEEEGHVFHLFKHGSHKAEELLERIVGFISGGSGECLGKGQMDG